MHRQVYIISLYRVVQKCVGGNNTFYKVIKMFEMNRGSQGQQDWPQTKIVSSSLPSCCINLNTTHWTRGWFILYINPIHMTKTSQYTSVRRVCLWVGVYYICNSHHVPLSVRFKTPECASCECDSCREDLDLKARYPMNEVNKEINRRNQQDLHVL